ncbi:Oligosaccharide translocation protein rft1 [Arachnomyces sp. PD_36]|nr:Oligosaccharide translocation protein rft1 [Arachnomyces sp. PD_36]
MTFIANQALLRYLSPETLGVATQLELYSITLLFFARESIRIAVQRQPIGTEKDASVGHPRDGGRKSTRDSTSAQEAVNISYIPILLGIPFAFAFGLSYIRLAEQDALRTPYFQTSLKAIGVASLLELLTEPCFAIIQRRMIYRIRAIVETTASITKGVVTCGTAVWGYHSGLDIGVLPFAAGQVAFALILVVGYFAMVSPIPRKEGFSMRLVPISSRPGTKYVARLFSLPLLTLSANVYFQSIIKHILTQGDSMILATLASLEDQGVYALASNYGGLIARMLFQPIEEHSRNMYSKLLGPDAAGKPKPENVKLAKDQLRDILRAYFILSVLACSLGPTIVPLLLRLLVGSRWSTPQVEGLLSTYCYYIPFLAFNGITEAFVSSAASNSELRQQTMWMGAFSAGFAAAAFLFLGIWKWGAYGLVWANVVNMAVRTAWSYRFTRNYLRRNDSQLAIADILPKLETQVAGVVAAATMLAARPSLDLSIQTFAKVVGLAAFWALLM